MIIIDPNTNKVMSEYDFRMANPTISFPAVMTAENVADHGAAVVEETQPPAFDAATQYPATDGAVQVNGKWQQKWVVKDFTQAELDARKPPTIEQKLINSGLTLDELKAALGL